MVEQRNTNPLIRDGAWSLLAIALTGMVRAGARFGAGIISVDALRTVTIALSIAGIISIVTAGGWSSGIIKFLSELRGSDRSDDGDRLATLASWVVVGLSTIGAAAALWYSVTAADFDWAPAALTAALTVVFGLYIAGKSIAYGRQQVKRQALLEIVGFGLFAVSLFAILRGSLAQWVIVPLVVGFLPVASLAVGRLRHLPSWRGLPIRSFAGYGLVGVVGSLAGLGFTSITPLAADRLDAAIGAALVGATLTYLEPLTLTPRAISLVLLPELSRGIGRGDDRTEAAKAVRVATAISALLAGPLVAVLIVQRDSALQWLFPDDLVGGSTLAWFAAAFWVSVIGAPAIAALAAIRLREASVAMWSSLVGFAVAIAMWFALGERMGVAAIGLGYFVGSCIQVAAPLVIATRFYSIGWGTLWLRLAAAAAGVVAIAATGSGLLRNIAGVALVVAVMAPELRLAAVLLRRRRGSG